MLAADRAPGAAAETLDATLDWISPGARLDGTGDPALTWQADALKRRVAALAARLRSRLPAGAVVGSLADNSPHWLIADLALSAASMVHVPLPGFFTSEQLAHAMRASAMSGLFCQDTRLAVRLGFTATVLHDESLGCHLRPPQDHIASPVSASHASIAKITFTSGTTGAPKGVLLSFEQQLATARSLATATAGLGIERHLCLLPLPVLLENVAGAYTALHSGAVCICPGLDEIGMQGASGFDARRCLDLLIRQGADSLILLPQMLRGLVDALEANPARRSALPALKLVAVGGARTPAALIDRARELGLPVYEGYGLSECASVVSLNLPHADVPGSVGRALPGVGIRVANDGEVQVRGRDFAGYLGTDAPAPDAWLATGDLGRLDADGYLHLVGRRKNVLVTSYGRNVSPEWPEALIAEHAGIVQSVVFGDAQPFLVAVVGAVPALDDAEIDRHVANVNNRLPDYARLGGWLRAREPFTPGNGLATANGRPRREAVYARYAEEIAAIYRSVAGASASVNFAAAHQTRMS